MGKVTVDLSALNKLQEALIDSHAEKLQLGWFPSANYDDSLSVAQVAFWQEFGTKTAPPRSFFRPAIADNKTKWAALVDSGASAVIEGRATMNDVFNGLGLAAQADVKNAITGSHQALSPVTLALRKLKSDGQTINGTLVGAVAAAIERGETGSGQLGEPFANTTPLQDSGIMLATITYNLGESE
tara:strand:- start:303 stop:857 length:555 start_codon:yes stop_codon:yes gene_type:complete